MNKEFIRAWEKNKGELKEYFKKTSQEYYEYLTMVKKILEIVINPERDDEFDTENITFIDNGDYQGTQIFVIPIETYQPDENDYIITSVDYGSCSGCDTLERIRGYEDKIPTDEQVEDYMILCLHLVQKMKWL